MWALYCWPPWPTSVLGDVADPRQGLITALLDDLQVTHLWRENKVVLSQRGCAEGQRTGGGGGGGWRSSRHILCSMLLLLIFLKKDDNIYPELNYLLSMSPLITVLYFYIDIPWLHICRHDSVSSRYPFLKLPVVFVFVLRFCWAVKVVTAPEFMKICLQGWILLCSGLAAAVCGIKTHMGAVLVPDMLASSTGAAVGCLFVGLLELVKPVYPASIKASTGMFENNHFCSLVSEYIEKLQIVA